MAEKFIVVWTIDGETMSMPHSTQDEALQQAETLLREHGCNLEITLVPTQNSDSRRKPRDFCVAAIPSWA
jgi:hypothetical protein